MQTEFIAYTSVGKSIRTFATRKQALAWWLERSCEFPGARLEEVTEQLIITRKTLRGARQERKHG